MCMCIYIYIYIYTEDAIVDTTAPASLDDVFAASFYTGFEKKPDP